MKWWGWWRKESPESVLRAEAEAELRRTQRQTRVIQRLAPAVADLPADEFADRVGRAFRRRPT